MNIVSLRRRFASTIIDKVLILFLFVIFAMIFCSGSPGAELGTFTGNISRKYKEIESKRTIYEQQKDIERFMKENGYNYNDTDQEYEHYKTPMDVYHKHILIFIIVNLLYYLLCEYFFKASLGKKFLRCKICKKDGSEIGKYDMFSRVGILGALLLLAVALQIILNLNVYTTSILFFGILDYTVFTKQQSLVDKYSETYVVKIS